MKEDDFRGKANKLKIKKGSFIATKTKNSICTGYFLEACLRTSQGGFINLSATRKIGQGREEEDWYDHTYSIPLKRIIDITVIDEPFETTTIHRAQKKLKCG